MRRWAPILGGLLLAAGARLLASQEASSAGCKAVDRRALTGLGQALFFETSLSETGTLSCASCHRPELSFSDDRPFSPGQRGEPTTRNTPPLINRPEHGFQFWDGRALSLSAQAIFPLENPQEMGTSATVASARVAALTRYAPLFEAAFGSEEVSPCRLGDALAAFVATLTTHDSDFERQSRAALLPSDVVRGEALFRGKARCALCHSGPDFTDGRFHDTGIAWKASSPDLGRGALTGRTGDLRAFKTPTLRELVRTAPYMHDGSLKTLEDVVRHYADGGARSDPGLDPALKPVALSPEETRDLLAFLRSLSDSRRPPPAKEPGPEANGQSRPQPP
jgi:cytochrome c peroxidase